MNYFDTPTDYNIPVTSPPPSSNLKHPQYHPCDDCPDGWKFDDDINTDDITTTEIASENSQPFSFDDKPDSNFDTDTTSKFIFDLEAKTATYDDTAATDSIVFDDKPVFDDKTDRNADDDDLSDEDDYSTVYDLRNPPKISGCTYQKARRANDRTILPTKIYTSPPDKCTLKFF